MEKAQEPVKIPRRRIKKVKGHGGHHGGAWKVAYADFVTAMMALFLVLWLVSQADTKLKQAIASYFRSPGVFDSMAGGVLAQAKKVSREPTSQTSKDDEQALFSVAQSLQKQFSSKPEFSQYKDRVKIDVTDEGLRIQLIDKADKVSFSSGSADLAPDAQAILAEIAGGICALPNKINIGGHTDSRVFPSDNGYTNWELSTDRANAARRILETNCVKSEQIHRIVGFADTEPMVPDDPFSPANRRISITVLRLTQPQDKNAVPKPGDKTDSQTDGKSDSGANGLKDSAETKLAKAKLKHDGAVAVGESDKIPDKPKVH
ncbi:MAG TPA: flagellar motor protein MotB [Pyrinomonadaceae bacterium]|nr:flagellar motor protein MotB [Pyrinomonadaceae bacterium]